MKHWSSSDHSTSFTYLPPSVTRGFLDREANGFLLVVFCIISLVARNRDGLHDLGMHVFSVAALASSIDETYRFEVTDEISHLPGHPPHESIPSAPDMAEEEKTLLEIRRDKGPLIPIALAVVELAIRQFQLELTWLTVLPDRLAAAHIQSQ